MSLLPFKQMSWFTPFTKMTVTAGNPGKLASKIAHHDLLMGFRLFDSCVPLLNYNRIPYECSALLKSRKLTKESIDKSIKIDSSEMESTVYRAIVYKEVDCAKMQVDSLQFDDLTKTLSRQKLNGDVLGWFNYYPKPTAFVTQKVMAILQKRDPEAALRIYDLSFRQKDLYSDIYLDNIALKCYFLLNQTENATKLLKKLENKKDDVTWSILLEDKVKNNDFVGAEKIYLDFRKSKVVSSIESIRVYSSYLASTNRADELINILEDSKFCFYYRFDLLLSIALHSILSTDNTSTSFLDTIVKHFDAKSLDKCSTVLKNHHTLGQQFDSNNDFNNALIQVVKDFKTNGESICYINNKEHPKWQALTSFMENIDQKKTNSITASILLLLPHLTSIISKRIDADIISYKILDAPLPETLQKYLDEDKFIDKYFNYPFLAQLDNATLMRDYTKLARYASDLSLLEKALVTFNADLNLQISAFTKYFQINKNKGTDYKILSHLITRIIYSDRTNLREAHFLSLFELYSQKPIYAQADKKPMFNLLINLSSIDANDLLLTMERFYKFDKNFCVELFESLEFVIKGDKDSLKQLYMLYYMCLDKNGLQLSLKSSLEHLQLENSPSVVKNQLVTALQNSNIPECLSLVKKLKINPDKLHMTESVFMSTLPKAIKLLQK